VPLGITIELPDWAPPEAAQVLRLSRYDAGVRGEVEYPPGFNTGARTADPRPASAHRTRAQNVARRVLYAAP
jgi:hypothetical protein